MDVATIQATVTEHWIPIAVTLAVLIAAFLFRGSGSGGKSKKNGVMSTTAYKAFPLKEKISVNHNTNIYRFGLPKETDTLPLPIGQHIFLSADLGPNNKPISRPYTPISSAETQGHFDLLIKVYPQGKMSSHVDSLQIGDTINVKGPRGRFKYQPNQYKFLGMIAGGTGLTPMYQIITAALKDPSDSTRLSLIFANVAEEDILLKEELDTLAKQYPEQFSVFYCLQDAPEGWTDGVGFVNQDMIKQNMDAPGDGVMITLCGPPPMTDAMTKHLEALGYDTDRKNGQVFKF